MGMEKIGFVQKQKYNSAVIVIDSDEEEDENKNAAEDRKRKYSEQNHFQTPALKKAKHNY